MGQFLPAVLIFSLVVAAAVRVPVNSPWHVGLMIAGAGPFLVICKTILRAICRGIERLIPAGRVKQALTKPRGVDQVVYEGWPLPVPRVKPHWLKATVGLIVLAGVVVLLIFDAINRQ
jgi:hypothetical protein